MLVEGRDGTISGQQSLAYLMVYWTREVPNRDRGQACNCDSQARHPKISFRCCCTVLNQMTTPPLAEEIELDCNRPLVDVDYSGLHQRSQKPQA